MIPGSTNGQPVTFNTQAATGPNFIFASIYKYCLLLPLSPTGLIHLSLCSTWTSISAHITRILPSAAACHPISALNLISLHLIGLPTFLPKHSNCLETCLALPIRQFPFLVHLVLTTNHLLLPHVPSASLLHSARRTANRTFPIPFHTTHTSSTPLCFSRHYQSNTAYDLIIPFPPSTPAPTTIADGLPRILPELNPKEPSRSEE